MTGFLNNLVDGTPPIFKLSTFSLPSNKVSTEDWESAGERRVRLIRSAVYAAQKGLKACNICVDLFQGEGFDM